MTTKDPKAPKTSSITPAPSCCLPAKCRHSTTTIEELIYTAHVCQPTVFSNQVFTMYTLTITDVSACRWWTIHKRFSDFYRFRRDLHGALKRRIVPPTSQWFVGIQALLSQPFPHKHYDVDGASIVQERAMHFQRFTHSLAHLYLQTEATGKCFDAISDTPSIVLVRTFLEVPAATKALNPTDIKCTICLSSLSDCVAVLACGHAFHRDCVFVWMEEKQSCPLCRQIDRAIGGILLL
ncbi:hypothetical protein LEN26_007418 [Aphanomyces euteiches]|nr:hypothetical protein AeMF1_003303 [Aphanomyces euteiches]KAH9132366.1 hypothetical protein LEN26_007418 [Aphanomyces euteiches]KAH9192316.1 hypothetical protein AeNC1_005715 [Aphanomyces euteiches]